MEVCFYGSPQLGIAGSFQNSIIKEGVNMKANSKLNPQKLTLHRETIKRLSVEDLRAVRGGRGLGFGCGETECKSDKLCTVASQAP
jgi:hypothetical protein